MIESAMLDGNLRAFLARDREDVLSSSACACVASAEPFHARVADNSYSLSHAVSSFLRAIATKPSEHYSRNVLA
jgi:hypothetical protein